MPTLYAAAFEAFAAEAAGHVAARDFLKSFGRLTAITATPTSRSPRSSVDEQRRIVALFSIHSGRH